MSHKGFIWKLLISLLLFSNCAPDQTILPLNDDEVKILESYENLKSENQVRLCHESEPGERLLLCLKFISKESKKPLRNQLVKLYHTSSSGNYEPSDPNDESTARLNGMVTTDEQGQAFIRSILPGAYGSSASNRHIHTTVEGARPEAYDIHFKQYSGGMGKRFITGSDQHFLADLKRSTQNDLVSFLVIEVKNSAQSK